MKYLFLFLMLCGLAFGDITLDRLPLWNPNAAGIGNDTSSGFAMNSADRMIGGVYVAKSTDKIHQILFDVSAVAGTGGKITGYITSVDATGGPDEGTVIQSTEVSISGTGWTTITLGTDADQTAGTAYGVILKNTDADPASNYATIYPAVSRSPAFGKPYSASTTDAGSTWTKSTGSCMVCPVNTSGDIPLGFSPFTGTMTAIKSDTGTADEYANAFTVPRNTVCVGFQAAVAFAAGCDFKVNLYEGTGASAIKRTVTIDGDAVAGAATYFFVVEWPAYTLTTGNTYRISIQPTTTTAGLKVAVTSFKSATEMAEILGSGCTAYLSKTINNIDDGNGVWTDVETSYLNIVPLVTTLTIPSGRVRSAWGF